MTKPFITNTMEIIHIIILKKNWTLRFLLSVLVQNKYLQRAQIMVGKYKINTRLYYVLNMSATHRIDNTQNILVLYK